MSSSEAKKSKRYFDCSNCSVRVQRLRRCDEDRFDFDHTDGAIWPMRIQEGGSLYGFCPAKATWDQEIVSLYNLLVVSYETKQLLYTGGIADQPGWFVDLLSWFVSRYDENKFYSRAQSILGSNNKVQNSGNQSGSTHSRGGGRRQRRS